MSAVHIGIGHQDDLVVTELGNIKIFVDTRTKGGDHSFDLGIGINLVKTRLLHIQDLTSKRQNGLGRTGSGCLCGSACGISLYDIDLTF